MRVVITGGGTGGHIVPALAVAKALQTDAEISKVLYIGNRDGLERELAAKEQVEFQGIAFYGMPRRPGLKLIRWYLDLQRAIKEAKQLLKTFSPDVVFGTGGYVSAPVLLAAQALKIPTVVHEPDAHPGLANRFLARGAKHITAAFTESRQRFNLPENSPKFTVTGNPIRPAFGKLAKAEALTTLGLTHWQTGKPILLVFGGSQGAQRINHAVVEALPRLLETLNVIHLTGAKRYDETLQALPEPYRTHASYKVMSFSAQMPELLAASDLALCRAGSMTLSELTASGLPAVLVPYPFAAANHQHKNALAAVAAGAALLLSDADCSGERLLETLVPLSQDRGRLALMAENARKLARPQATAAIIECMKASPVCVRAYK